MKDTFAEHIAELSNNVEILAILREVCDITDMGFSAVARVTEDRWIACQVIDKIEFGLEPGGELEVKTTICNEIREWGQAIYIDRVFDNIAWNTHPTPILYGFESYASLPIFLDDGSFFGTMCAIDPKPRALSAPATIEALEKCAQRIAHILSGSPSAQSDAAPPENG
jgi:GAF domain-containing protein